MARASDSDQSHLNSAWRPAAQSANMLRPVWQTARADHMDNSTPVFWIWIVAVVLFATIVTVTYHFGRKTWRRIARHNGSK